MWILALALAFLLSDTPGPGDIYIAQNEEDGYWYLGRYGEDVFAGPYVSQEHAARASRHAGYGELTDEWFVHYFVSPFGTGYWAYRRRGLSGPFETMNEALDWVAEQEGLQGA